MPQNSRYLKFAWIQNLFVDVQDGEFQLTTIEKEILIDANMSERLYLIGNSEIRLN